MAEKRHSLIAKEKFKNRQSTSKTCSDCNSSFQTFIELLRHEKRKRNLACLHCSRKFCTNDQLQKHIRTINYRGGSITDYESVINPKFGYEDSDGFIDLLTKHEDEIEDKDSFFSSYKIYNRKIEHDYSYGDLDSLLNEIFLKERSSFKLNIAFGFVLYHITTGEYRYHYVSSNTLLFEHAITITNPYDIDKFMERPFYKLLSSKTNQFMGSLRADQCSSICFRTERRSYW